MVSNSTFKIVQSLQLKKFRQKYNLFVAEGRKQVTTILSQKKLRVSRVFTSEEWAEDNEELLQKCEVELASSKELKKLSSLKTPGDVIALIDIPPLSDLDVGNNHKVLYLDNIQDPGNVGTMIRIADWYGLDCVVRSEGTADFFNPKVVQATMGSIGAIELGVIPVEQFGEAFSDYRRIGAMMRSFVKENDKTKTDKKCLVIGNEGHGISPAIEQHLTSSITIKGAENRAAESLNAAVAAGILCQELFGIRSL